MSPKSFQFLFLMLFQIFHNMNFLTSTLYQHIKSNGLHKIYYLQIYHFLFFQHLLPQVLPYHFQTLYKVLVVYFETLSFYHKHQHNLLPPYQLMFVQRLHFLFQKVSYIDSLLLLFSYSIILYCRH